MNKYFTTAYINSKYTSITTTKSSLYALTDFYEIARLYNTFYIGVMNDFVIDSNYSEVKYKIIA